MNNNKQPDFWTLIMACVIALALWNVTYNIVSGVLFPSKPTPIYIIVTATPEGDRR